MLITKDALRRSIDSYHLLKLADTHADIEVTPSIDMRINMCNAALDRVGTPFSSEYLSVADTPWTGTHKPAWCGLFALFMAHRAGFLLNRRWHWETGFTSRPTQLRTTLIPQPGDIIYYLHSNHYAILVPDHQLNSYYAINGNGVAGCVSISRTIIDPHECVVWNVEGQ